MLLHIHLKVPIANASTREGLVDFNNLFIQRKRLYQNAKSDPLSKKVAFGIFQLKKSFLLLKIHFIKRFAFFFIKTSFNQVTATMYINTEISV
jgi:hypothetical protein